jgi:zinc/manganese transport system substrate-binding protein
MYCFTKNIAGDLADVEMIVPPGLQSRGFTPSPQEVQRILQADIVVENGFGFETWMDHLVENGLKPGAIRVLAARGTGPPIPGLPGDPDTPPGNAPADPTQPADPHVWLDPLMAIKEVQNIRDALMARDPAHANDYLANENQYEATLRDLDDEIGRTTVDITKRRLLCVTPAFTYFLSRYEFPVAGAVPTPADALAAAKTADGVLVPMGADTGILNGKGLRVVIADPMESGPASTDFYEQATRANANALREGLSQ